MRPSRVLFAISSYLAVFATAAPLANLADGSTTDLEQRNADLLEVRQPIGDLVASFEASRRDLEPIVSDLFDDNEDDNGDDDDDDEDDEDFDMQMEKREPATKTKTKSTTKPKPKTGTTKPKPKTGTTTKPKPSKTSSAPHKTSAAACSRKRNGGGCDDSTAEYKFVAKVAKKKTLTVGKSYAMISGGTLGHHRLVVAKVIKNSAGKLDIDAKMTQLVKDNGASGPLAGGETEQDPRDTWSCKGDEKWRFKGEVASQYENFNDVKAVGEQLIIDGGKYNVVTNSCQTFAKNLAKTITT